MGLFNDKKEIELLKNAGIEIEEDKEYTIEEKNNMSIQVSDYILSHSSKNGDIAKLQNEYSIILNKLVK